MSVSHELNSSVKTVWVSFCPLPRTYRSTSWSTASSPPYFSSKNVEEIFTSVEAIRYIMFVCKIFLANSFGKIIPKLSIYYVDIISSHIVVYATVWYIKTWITHKCSLRINFKLRIRLFHLLSYVIKLACQDHKKGTLNVISNN